MKAIIQSYNGGAPEVREMPPPALRTGGILVRNAVSLVSPGTERQMVELAGKSLLGKARQRPDLVRRVVDKVRTDGVLATVQTVRSRLDRPVPLGYSSAGTVIEVDRLVADLQPGDRVACAGAGYASHAEVVFVPRLLVAPVPDGVDHEAAAFTTLGAIALQGLRLARVELGETVAVIGLGLVGQLTAQLARAAGCRVVGMDTDVDRCRLAEQLGAQAATDEDRRFVSLCRESTSGAGADKVLITAGTPSSAPVELAARVSRDRATVVIVGAVGTEVPRQLYYEKELSLRVSRSYGPGRYDPTYEESGHDYPIGHVRWTENRNMQAFLDMLSRGSVRTEELISHRFGIDDAAGAYRLIAAASEEPSLGILLEYPTEESDSAHVPVATTSPAAAPLTEPAGRQDHDVIGIGVLGAGQFATGVLLPELKRVAGLELRGICTGGGVSAHHAAGKFGFLTATTSEEQILDDPQTTAVIITTRHHLHARQVVAALEAGKHVFVEKPLCLDEAELEEIEAAHAAAHADRDRPVVLLVGYNRRFAPLALRLEEFVRSIEEPLVIHYRINAPQLPLDHWAHDPAQGGGRIIGEVCHFVDFLVFLTDSTPTVIAAGALPNRELYRDDNLTATLRFGDGSIATVTYVANGSSALAKERVELSGGGSSAVLDNFRRLDLMRDGRRRTRRSRFRQDKGHRGELEAFVAAIRGRSRGPIPISRIVATSRATFDIRDSLRGS